MVSLTKVDRAPAQAILVAFAWHQWRAKRTRHPSGPRPRARAPGLQAEADGQMVLAPRIHRRWQMPSLLRMALTGGPSA